ncbi:MAG TPA: MaoC family dehydratase [Candidatus Udaeobacter sp.]|jgi:acyl dehydratase
MKFAPYRAAFKRAKQNSLHPIASAQTGTCRRLHLCIARLSWVAQQCASAILIMKERYFDDLKTGDRFKSEPLNVTVKEVVEFAHKFDPQMFHLSRRRAERSIFKGLIASGWHIAAMSMRLFVKTLNFTEGAIGLGVDELRWPNAVRPGDVLTVATEILALRPSRSRPGHGILRLRNVTTNQRGEVVQTMLASLMVPKSAKHQKAD